MKGKSKALYYLNNFEQYLGTYFAIAMVITMLLQVFSRYVLGSSFSWTDEMATIFFIWSIYLGCGCAVTKRKHLKIDILYRNVPFKTGQILRVASNIVFFIFCCYMFPAFIKVLINLAKYNTVTAITRIPKSFVYAIIPVALVLTGIRLIQDSLAILKEKESVKASAQQGPLEKDQLDDLSI